jgi:hypothetical protein
MLYVGCLSSHVTPFTLGGTAMSTTPSQNPLLALSPEEFERELLAYVNETAPKLFAVVYEWDIDGVRNAEVVGWGLEYEDGGVRLLRGGNGIVLLTSAQRAATWCDRVCGGPTRLVWLGDAGR